MTRSRVRNELGRLADAVLLPCFDGLSAPDWLRRRAADSLGGVCLFARNVASDDQVRTLTDVLRAERDDLVVAIDEEAGDVTRLDAATGSVYPGAAALGRVDDPELTRMIGRLVGNRLAAAGINLNFAPCSDVASDPANPVIGTRSFGASIDLVSRHTVAYILGQQQAGVGACAKHFPGHGGTGTDSHRAVAVIGADRDRIFAEAVPPFSAAIAAGVSSIMAGHLLVPSIDGQPATLSRRWLTEILRQEMGFGGVIVTDALEMQAVASSVGRSGPAGVAEAAVRALHAGADLLCLGGETMSADQLDTITDTIVAAVRSGRLDEQRLLDAVDRVRALPASLPPLEATATTSPDDAGRAAAGRALQLAGPFPRWTDPVLSLQCEERPNIAVGDIPWGPGALPNQTRHLHHLPLHRGDPLPHTAILAAGTVVLVTRDRHRHPWMAGALQAVRSLRDDTVLLEMGTTGVRPDQAPAIASYGATSVNARAALDALGAPTGATQ
jgi:beta-N-acetylhexosaminidase